MKISTVEQMRELDQKAITVCNIPEIVLMENAGSAASSIITENSNIETDKFLVICGSGNNGGDGLVTARKLFSNGASVKILLTSDATKFGETASRNYSIIKKINIPCQQISDLSVLNQALHDSDVIIDAIFGTGLTRNVSGIYAEIIDAVNKSKKVVFSIDIPSGINGNNGNIMGACITAKETITFGLPKLGNLLFPGAEKNGKLSVSHISFPPELYQNSQLTIEVNQPGKLLSRATDGHKGSFGQALFIAGAKNYYGAPAYAALSFLKAGGGYSRLAAPQSIIPFIAANAREIVYLPQPETSEGTLSIHSKDDLLALSAKMDFVVIGPGISLNPETKKLVIQLIKLIKKPILIDGDALTALSEYPEILDSRQHPTILTPHLGEMSKLTNQSIEEIKKDPIFILQETSKKINAHIVLKGAHSLITHPNGGTSLNLSGNCGMATAGSGDVLTGIIAAMYGQGLSIADAVKTGVFLHGFAGDLAAQSIGMDGMTAQDILEHLPAAIKDFRQDKHQNRYKIQTI